LTAGACIFLSHFEVSGLVERQHEEMEGAAQRRLSETGRAANARTLRSNLPDL
jgi:hypothetical protein